MKVAHGRFFANAWPAYGVGKLSRDAPDRNGSNGDFVHLRSNAILGFMWLNFLSVSVSVSVSCKALR